MKKSILFALALLPFSTLFSQTVFDKVIREQTLSGVSANGHYLTENRELIVSGNFISGMSHVSKIDSIGNPVWTRSFNLNDENNGGQPFLHKDNILTLQDSNFLLTRNVRDWSNTKILTYLIKFDTDGNLIWSKRIHKNDASNSYSSFSLQMNNGKILHVSSVDQSNQLEVLRINSNGQLENALTYSNMNTLKPVAFVSDSSSAYIISNSGGITYIAQMDDQGNYIDSRLINSSVEDAVYLDSTIHILGIHSVQGKGIASIDYANGTMTFQNGLTYEERILAINNRIVAINAHANNGTINVINPQNNQREYYSHMAGTVALYEHDSSHFYFVGNGPTWGVKAFGEPQIGISYFQEGQGSGCAWGPTPQPIDSIITDFAYTTFFQPPVSSNMLADTLILTWQSEQLTANIGCVDHLGDLNEYDLENRVQLSPNPGSDLVFIEAEDFIISSVEIVNINGQTMSKSFSANQLNVSSLPNGVYFVRINNNEDMIITKKLVIQH